MMVKSQNITYMFWPGSFSKQNVSLNHEGRTAIMMGNYNNKSLNVLDHVQFLEEDFIGRLFLCSAAFRHTYCSNLTAIHYKKRKVKTLDWTYSLQWERKSTELKWSVVFLPLNQWRQLILPQRCLFALWNPPSSLSVAVYPKQSAHWKLTPQLEFIYAVKEVI